MTLVHILSDDLIGKIAAGEVVERPASVVKELVENSIDAGAKEIQVFVECGGKKKIIVMDDGCGMGPEDAKLSILRHATSKIKTPEDLDSIHTLGFRGEALPSISAVSKLTIETSNGEISGFKIVVAGGKIVESGDFGSPKGTKILVEDLFYNTPARKKFLKGDKTEEGHIIDTLSRLALSFPNIRFKLTADGKEKLACLSVDDPKARLQEIFSGSLASSASEFEEKGDGIRIYGFLGSPGSAHRIAQGIYVFVNKRFIRDRLLNHAIVDGYRSLLPNGSYPFAIVMLDIDPTRVDVNVHPTKQEVRFDNSGAIHNFVASAVRKNVQKRTLASLQVNKSTCQHVDTYASQKFDAEKYRPLFQNQNIDLSTCGHADVRTYFSSLNVIGQLANSYIICEGANGKLIAIDQHAAHERIGFEKLKKQLEAGHVEQQQLLIPEQIELQAREHAYISEHLETLNALGIEIEPFGGKTFLIKSVPSLLSGIDVKPLILALANQLAEIGGSASIEETKEKALKTIACHAQVRANHSLKGEEMRSLLRQMDEWPNTDHCPHGRPSYKEFAADEIKKWFNR